MRAFHGDGLRICERSRIEWAYSGCVVAKDRASWATRKGSAERPQRWDWAWIWARCLREEQRLRRVRSLCFAETKKPELQLRIFGGNVEVEVGLERGTIHWVSELHSL